jgi:hypothetical protein
MDLRSIVTYLSIKDINAREIYADVKNTLGADCIGYSTVTNYLRQKSFWKSMLDTDFAPKISLMKQLLGLLRNAPLPYSARLPKNSCP